MTEEIVSRPAMLVIGIPARTTNEREADAATGQIGLAWARLIDDGLVGRIPARAHPGRLCAVLSDYESDHTGAYTIVIGAEVTSLTDLPEGMVATSVPAAPCVLVQARGPMPQALIETWAEIWRRFPVGSPGRAYSTDVELHEADGVDILLAVSR